MKTKWNIKYIHILNDQFCYKNPYSIQCQINWESCTLNDFSILIVYNGNIFFFFSYKLNNRIKLVNFLTKKMIEMQMITKSKCFDNSLTDSTFIFHMFHKKNK